MKNHTGETNTSKAPLDPSGIETMEPMVLLSACGSSIGIQAIDASIGSSEVEAACVEKLVPVTDVSSGCGGKTSSAAASQIIDGGCQTNGRLTANGIANQASGNANLLGNFGCGTVVDSAGQCGDLSSLLNDFLNSNSQTNGCTSGGGLGTASDANGISFAGDSLTQADITQLLSGFNNSNITGQAADGSAIDGTGLTQAELNDLLVAQNGSASASADTTVTITTASGETITVSTSASSTATATPAADAAPATDPATVTPAADTTPATVVTSPTDDVVVIDNGTTVLVGSTTSADDGNTASTTTPVVEVPVIDAPVIDIPVIDIPVIDIPVIDIPVIDDTLTSVAVGEFRSIDGTGNNLVDPNLGATDTELIRLIPGDGTPSPSDVENGLLGLGLPTPRDISNIVSDQDVSIPNGRGTSDYLWAWGQFLDHDITLTEAGNINGEKAPIPVPLGDPQFDPLGTGTATMDFTRSDYELDANGVRQFENDITAFIDGSQIYGSDSETAALLRDGVGGKLRVSAGNLLPFGETTGESTDDVGGTAFIAGDVRANENAALTSLHTLFVREHNRIADEIAMKDFANADLTDPAVNEQIFQNARQLVAAQLQQITYNEFLPALLGEDAVASYNGYDPNVDPSIANEFSTGAYRIGHTMLSDMILRLDENGNEIAEGNLALRDAFFRPDKVIESGIDPILRGLSAQASQEVDPFLIDDVRNFLFGEPGQGGLDLASLNIQRGRDHGLPSYVEAREALGLSAICDFCDISSDPEVVSRLQAAYGTVDKIDFWVGGLAEDHVSGSSTGELFSNVIADQFVRLRDGDRFYFENALSADSADWVSGRKLSDVIRDNTTVDQIVNNVFFVENGGSSYA